MLDIYQIPRKRPISDFCIEHFHYNIYLFILTKAIEISFLFFYLSNKCRIQAFYYREGGQQGDVFFLRYFYQFICSIWGLIVFLVISSDCQSYHKMYKKYMHAYHLRNCYTKCELRMQYIIDYVLMTVQGHCIGYLCVPTNLGILYSVLPPSDIYTIQYI